MTFSVLCNIEIKFKKKFSNVLNTFETIMENAAFAQRSKCSNFHNIFKYMMFHRRQNELSWSKGLKSSSTPLTRNIDLYVSRTLAHWIRMMRFYPGIKFFSCTPDLGFSCFYPYENILSHIPTHTRSSFLTYQRMQDRVIPM